MKYSRVNQAMQTVSMRARVGLSIGFPFASCTDITKIEKDWKTASCGEYLKIEWAPSVVYKYAYCLDWSRPNRMISCFLSKALPRKYRELWIHHRWKRWHRCHIAYTYTGTHIIQYTYCWLRLLAHVFPGKTDIGGPPQPPPDATFSRTTEPFPEAKFLDVIGTKALRVFLLAIHSHLY